MNQTLEIAAMVLVFCCALINLVRHQWAINLAALAIQYLGVFALVLSVRTVAMAFVTLFVGLMTTLILAVTLIEAKSIKSPRVFSPFSSGELFRVVAGIVAIVFVALLIPTIRSDVFPGTGTYLLFASLGLMMLSLLQMGMVGEPFYTILGLLSFFSGFQLLYASLETSALLVALFVILTLGLGLVGAFFLVKLEDATS